MGLTFTWYVTLSALTDTYNKKGVDVSPAEANTLPSFWHLRMRVCVQGDFLAGASMCGGRERHLKKGSPVVHQGLTVIHRECQISLKKF